ncbi:MAG: hypothetical protein LBO78_01740 [Rickettsiales bacterium]|jgi:hypothetical protein|nr:hypothetical protein [Rickettsiales bacterium]
MNDIFDDTPAGVREGKGGMEALAREFARTFGGESGKKVLAYLRSITLGRYLAPRASNEELRYLEGQRYLVSFISNMAEKGKRG